MTIPLGRALAFAASVALLAAQPGAVASPPAAMTLPAALSDRDFWQLSELCSEPNGYFRSENLVSNEHTYQNVVPALRRLPKPGGVYLGVAPDQNFTYLVATEPRLAFIVDIRRGNLLEHLMYKAILELSPDRAEFVSRLFSKPRPARLTAASTVTEIFDAYDGVATSETLYRKNLEDLHTRLATTHGFPLSKDDWEQLETIYFSFYWAGPDLRYTMGGAPAGAPFGMPQFRGFGLSIGNFPSYEDLQLMTDAAGIAHSYLASEKNYEWLRAFEGRNLLVPVVGNFAGPKALRAVGAYARAHGATVTAFYVSNVEQYLFQDGLFNAFADNVATLPVDASSVFIRSVADHFGYAGTELGPDGRASALDPIRAFIHDFQSGRITSYYDVNRRSR